MNNPELPNTSNHDPGQESQNLHTDDILEKMDQFKKRQEQVLAGLKGHFSPHTSENIKALRNVANHFNVDFNTQNIGTVKRVGDGVAYVSGLRGVLSNELVVFPDGTFGLAMDLHEHFVGCVILGSGENIQAGDVV